MKLNVKVRIIDARNTMFNTTGEHGIVKEINGDRVFVVQTQGMWQQWFNVSQVEVCA